MSKRYQTYSLVLLAGLLLFSVILNFVLNNKADKTKSTLDSVVNTVISKDITDYSRIRYVPGYLTNAISDRRLYTSDMIYLQQTMNQVAYTYQELTFLYGPLHSYEESSHYIGEHGLFSMLQDFDIFFASTLSYDPANTVSTDSKGEYIQLSDSAVEVMRALHEMISELVKIQKGHDESKIFSLDWKQVMRESEAYLDSPETETKHRMVIDYNVSHATKQS
ncbi:hypothetical protein [Paenibacillus kobensis]|uniref:hypothetical protein n=1 Tax=Paenibacillus kobensis TaxID=59841 RepID=UPI000FD8F656|nr:hypothetical protein [Paenibacillus kobensis]